MRNHPDTYAFYLETSDIKSIKLLFEVFNSVLGSSTDITWILKKNTIEMSHDQRVFMTLDTNQFDKYLINSKEVIICINHIEVCAMLKQASPTNTLSIYLEKKPQNSHLPHIVLEQ